MHVHSIPARLYAHAREHIVELTYYHLALTYRTRIGAIVVQYDYLDLHSATASY